MAESVTLSDSEERRNEALRGLDFARPDQPTKPRLWSVRAESRTHKEHE